MREWLRLQEPPASAELGSTMPTIVLGAGFAPADVGVFTNAAGEAGVAAGVRIGAVVAPMQR